MKKNDFLRLRIGEKVKIIKNIGDKWFDRFIGEYATILEINEDSKVMLNIPTASQSYGETEWELDEIEKVDDVQRTLE